MSVIISELLLTMRAFASGSKHSAVSAVYSTIVMLQQELKGVGITIELSDDNLPSVLEQLSVFDSFAELEDFVLKLIVEIQTQVKAKTGNKELIQLLQVKQYIQEHYAENITLESSAALVFMNPYYFVSVKLNSLDHYWGENHMPPAFRNIFYKLMDYLAGKIPLEEMLIRADQAWDKDIVDK